MTPRFCALRGKHFACRIEALPDGDFCALHRDWRSRPRKPMRCGTCGVVGHNARSKLCDLVERFAP